ncbi:hypothetical protein SAMN05660652_01042 [Propionivibrio dicarboxylicus]|uniref:Uncharacterized protein n=1 Tax=Propionivibrio dicarboxylicus TaxID=83767 RepID=A0A1G7Z125_9RHOO|nr:hypothetical protein SAMN05660652_01042 [Propionivibrio dicarboxylicus]
MAAYKKCPTCKNHERGTTIYRCNHCGAMWCLKVGFIFDSGCGAGMNRCSRCGREKTPSFFGRGSFREIGCVG